MEEASPGFKYFVEYNAEGTPVGVMWMTPRQREIARAFAEVLFLDFKWGGGNNLLWPWAGPTVIDQEGHLRLVASAFYSTESDEAYRY
jgi:hypothetical protein